MPGPIVVVMLAFPADTDCDTRHPEGPASHLKHDRPADGRCRRVATLVSLRRVYTHGKEETDGTTSATLVKVTPKISRRRRIAVLGAAVVVAAGAVATVVALNRSRVAFEEEHTRPLAVGDCVAVTAAPPDAVQTRRSSCADDPSFTIGAMADGSGSCPTAEYQHFPAPSADRVTAELCLVPNLVAEHCYRLGMPIGVVERAECTDSGVLVQVTQRLDVHDQHACPSSGGSFAWPYPSPARTYCTSTLY